MKYKKGRKTERQTDSSASGKNSCPADRTSGAVPAGIEKTEKISIVPYLFEQYLILSLDYRFVSVFGCVPTFDVTIDRNGRLAIVSQEACLK